MKLLMKGLCLFILAILSLSYDSSFNSQDNFTLTSPAFVHKGFIPEKYAYRIVQGGKNISLPFKWENPPEGTKSFAFLMYDRHPVAKNWIHWGIVDIAPSYKELPEGASKTNNMPENSIEIINSYGETGYGGPAPPKGTGKHEYACIIYALNIEKTTLPHNVDYEAFVNKMKDITIDSAEIVGYFSQDPIKIKEISWGKIKSH